MKFLTIILNIIFLFSFGTEQAYCFCNENDECQGMANLLLSKAVDSLKNENRDSISEVISSPNSATAENSLPKLESNEQIKSTSDDCCADCFTTMNSATVNSWNFDSEFLELKSTFIVNADLQIKNRGARAGKSVRAPPSCGSGTKTYLVKRSLLI